MSERRIKRWLPPLALLLGVGVLGAMRENRAGGELAWASNFEAGSKLARQTHKMMLLSFHAPGCGWCEKLDAETFTDPQVVELSRRFVCVRLESDLDDEVAQRYTVFEYPMTLITDPQGRTMAQLPGYIPPDRFGAVLRALLDAAAKRH
jgi:thioredoxin-related protein